MGTLSTLLVALEVDSKDFDQGLSGAEGKAAGFAQRVGAKLNALGGKMQSFGKTATLGATLPIVGLGTAAVAMASDAEESANKVSVVFGSMAGSIAAFADTSADAFGLSRAEALEALGTFGNLFDAMGIGEDTTADMSKGLVGLAADLASFNNMDPTEVLDKLRAGLVGEVEPLRTLGVNLNQAMLETKALEMGLWQYEGALNAADKAQAAYALIMEQTTNAQGDFARTSEGLANASRIAKAQLADIAAELGSHLLPFVQQAVNWISDLMARFQGLSPSIQRVIVVVAALAAAIGPLVFVLGTVISAAGSVAAVLSGPLLLVLGVVAGAVALLAMAWANNWGGIQEKVAAAWAAIQPIIEMLIQWLQTNIPIAIQALADFWNNTLYPALTVVWEWMQANLIPIFQQVADFLQVAIPAAVVILVDIWQNVLAPALLIVFDIFQDYILPGIQAVVNLIRSAFILQLRVLAGIWQNVLLPALQAVGDFLADTIYPAFQDVAQFVETNLGPVLQWLSDNVITPLAGAFSAVADAIQGVIKWINDLAAKLDSIELPGWLTPGSPTPFELGIRGISGALREISQVRLPELDLALRVADPDLALSAQVAALAGGAQGDTFVMNNYDQLSAALAWAEVESRQKRRLAASMGG